MLSVFYALPVVSHNMAYFNHPDDELDELPAKEQRAYDPKGLPEQTAPTVSVSLLLRHLARRRTRLNPQHMQQSAFLRVRLALVAGISVSSVGSVAPSREGLCRARGPVSPSGSVGSCLSNPTTNRVSFREGSRCAAR